MNAMHSTVLPLEIANGIRRWRELPPVHESHQRLMSVLNDDTNARDLADAIETCPEVAARILGLARSAYFAQRIPCRSIHDAIVRVLGFSLVKSLVIGIIMSGSFPPGRCPGFNSRLFWSSAVLSATLARSLARITAPLHRPHPDECYLCGLLHNIGVLVLAHLCPDDMSMVFAEAAQDPACTLMDAESKMLGFDHTQAGGVLARRWQLSSDVRTVIEKHRDVDYWGTFWSSCMLVGASANVASQILNRDDDAELRFPDLVKLRITPDEVAAVSQRTVKELASVLELVDVFV